MIRSSEFEFVYTGCGACSVCATLFRLDTEYLAMTWEVIGRYWEVLEEGIRGRY